MPEHEDQYRPQRVRDGVAVCFSGGGFRATLFHLGALRRINEFGVLSRVRTFTSVSGGSILNGALAAGWNELEKTIVEDVFTGFDKVIANPVRQFCSKDLRTDVLVWDRLKPTELVKLMGQGYSVANLLAKAYAESLGLAKPFKDLPAKPSFVFCATNLETGVNWEYENTTDGGSIGDYMTGKARADEMTLADAVAASSAFPVTFPPMVHTFDDPSVFKKGDHNIRPESLKLIPLTDGGVYDNLGLEPVWKSHRVLLVSDAGLPLSFVDDPKQHILARLKRCFEIVMNQAGAIRKRWLIAMFQENVLHGTYWGVATDHENYKLDGSVGYGPEIRKLLRDVRTDLDAFTEGEIGCLENHGYSLADTAMRRWAPDELSRPDAEFKWPAPKYVEPAAARAALEKSHDRGILRDLWHSISRQFKDWVK